VAKSSLENVLKSVLSVGNAEQNFAYPPHVFEQHFNIVTSFLIDAFVETYPKYVEVLQPFMISKRIAVTDGYVKFPSDYRNLLGAPSINVKPGGGDCSDNNPIIIDTKSEFKTANLKSGCKSYPIEIVDKGQWDARTTSEYAFPTYENPIGLYKDENKLKVCPYDLATVEILYVKNEKQYRYGYITQPDDTFIYNVATSVESEWNDAASKWLVKGCLALYAAYSQNKELKDYSLVLNQAGLF
jgi:hypothetical protein